MPPSDPTRVTGVNLGLTIPPGTRLNGIFEIERQIGAGGMGMVYRAHNVETGDAVAIKIVRAELADNQQVLALFRKEAAVLHKLFHDAIVRYYLFTSDPDIGRPYLATEFVDGTSLADIAPQGPLPVDEVLALAVRLADGLKAAHAVPIFHRDISPDNVILPDRDVKRAKIIDFGIAKAATVGGGTVIGDSIAGKFDYMSPEQLGLFGAQVDGRSDIYSLGIVLAEATLGRSLDMGGTQLEVVEKRRKVPDLGDIDQGLRGLLTSMTQPKPEDRIQTMAEVAAEANRLRTGGPRSKSGKGGFFRMAAGLVGVAVVGGAAFVFLTAEDEPSQADFDEPPRLVENARDPVSSGAPPLTATTPEPVVPPLESTADNAARVADPPSRVTAEGDDSPNVDIAALDTAVDPIENAAEAAVIEPAQPTVPPDAGETSTETTGPPAEVAAVEETNTAPVDVPAETGPAGEVPSVTIPDLGTILSAIGDEITAVTGDPNATPPSVDPAQPAKDGPADPLPPVAEDTGDPAAPTETEIARLPDDAVDLPDDASDPFVEDMLTTDPVEDGGADGPPIDAEGGEPIADGNAAQGGGGEAISADDVILADPPADPPIDTSAPAPQDGASPDEVDVAAIDPNSSFAPAGEPEHGIMRYVRQSNLGPCTHLRLTKVGASSATIDAYGATVPPFQRFDRDFEESMGFEAQINLRPVTSQQCPAVDLVDRLTPNDGGTLRLQVDDDIITAGDVLSGAITGINGRDLQLFLVGSDGRLYNLDGMISRGRDDASIHTVMSGSSGPSDSHVLLAIAGTALPDPPRGPNLDAAQELALMRLALGAPNRAEAVLGYFKYTQ
ncbi:MAG: protein kinase [Pseudomonadota bacterium]